MRIFAALATLLFAYSAVVQVNDPDPVRWFALYATACALCAASPFRPIPRAVSAALVLVAAVWAVTLAPSVAAARAFTGTEEERELGGLLLVCLAGAVLYRRAHGAGPRSAS